MGTTPINPPPVTGAGSDELPAYVSNGLIGLRIRANPLDAGIMMLAGYTGEHPVLKVEAAARAPYPLALDIALDGIWMSDVPSRVEIVEQTYDFGCGELSSRIRFALEGTAAELSILTFCSRDQPTIACQEVHLEVDGAADIGLRVLIDGRGVDGMPLALRRDLPGEAESKTDGALLWESAGGIGRCGIAYATELRGAGAEPKRPPLHNDVALSEFAFRAHAGRRYRLRQIVSAVAGVLHKQPEHHAVRLLGKAQREGFDALRQANRKCWEKLWRSRIRLIGADERWQAMADAAFFYMNTSVHPSSPGSTSMFGLSTWRDYHYYLGHVMWDIEAFAIPPLTFFQPEAAASLLGYRYGKLDAARRNAHLFGRRGLQFPWESSPSTGEETAPLPGTASWHEDHVSLAVALAFGFYADVSGEERFLADYAWPVLSGVADWLTTRTVETGRGVEMLRTMGIAERKEPSDNSAYTNMAARMVLHRAIGAAERLGRGFDSGWQAMSEKLVLPMRGDIVLSHDGYRRNEEKGETPDPLMGIFPVWHQLPREVEQATLAYYLERADEYAGAPMLSALLGVWAAWTGDRKLAAKLLEDGYGRFQTGRFAQTLEYRPDKFPEQPRASPFLANIGGFLTGLVLGFPGIRPTVDDPRQWPARPVVLPDGWDAIEVDLQIRRRSMTLTAKHGADRAVLQELG